MTIYTRMFEILQHQLSTAGIPQETAIECSAIALDRVRQEVGGTNNYLPLRNPWRGRLARNIEIRRRFNGRNIDEICREYRVSRSTVYRVCRKK